MGKLDLNETAGIIIDTDSISAKMISVIKKYRKDSIAAIRSDVLNHRFVLSCNYISEVRKFKRLIKCYDELTKAGFKVDAYFAGEKESIQVFRNWANTSDEISSEGWSDVLADE